MLSKVVSMYLHAFMIATPFQMHSHSNYKQNDIFTENKTKERFVLTK